MLFHYAIVHYQHHHRLHLLQLNQITVQHRHHFHCLSVDFVLLILGRCFGYYNCYHFVRYYYFWHLIRHVQCLHLVRFLGTVVACGGCCSFQTGVSGSFLPGLDSYVFLLFIFFFFFEVFIYFFIKFFLKRRKI